eukprot:4947399-Karenia_brevis.AAC.1
MASEVDTPTQPLPLRRASASCQGFGDLASVYRVRRDVVLGSGAHSDRVVVGIRREDGFRAAL